MASGHVSENALLESLRAEEVEDARLYMYLVPGPPNLAAILKIFPPKVYMPACVYWLAVSHMSNEQNGGYEKTTREKHEVIKFSRHLFAVFVFEKRWKTVVVNQ